jgi:hypothetical protein
VFKKETISHQYRCPQRIKKGENSTSKIVMTSRPLPLGRHTVQGFAQTQRQVMADKKVARYSRLENKIQAVINYELATQI